MAVNAPDDEDCMPHVSVVISIIFYITCSVWSLSFLNPCRMFISCSDTTAVLYVTGFARRGLIRALFQHTDFTTILHIHYQTIHAFVYVLWPTVHQSAFLRLLSKTRQTFMNARFVFSRLCFLLAQKVTAELAYEK